MQCTANYLPLDGFMTGIRRCGKSTLLELFQEYLLQTGVLPEQIIAYNLEAGEYADIKSYKELYDMAMKKLLPDRMNYIFLDEVQHIADFQKAVDGLFIKKIVMCTLPVPMRNSSFPYALELNRPKYLLTKDVGPVVSHNGIRQVNVFDWLLK